HPAQFDPLDIASLLRLLECQNLTESAAAVRGQLFDIEEAERRALPTLRVVAAAYAALMLVGACGNGIVAYIVLANRRLRTPRNLYIANLALSDLTLCGLTQPLNLVKLFQRYNGWAFGQAACKLVNTLTGLNAFVSTYAIVAIACDRLLYLRGPRRNSRPGTLGQSSTSISTGRSRLSGRGKAARTIVCVWILAALLASPLAWFAEIVEFRSPLGLRLLCTELAVLDWRMKLWKLGYSGLALLVQYLVPLCTVTVAYGIVCHRLNGRVRRRRTSPNLTAYQRRRAEQEWRRSRRANLVLALIILVFAIAWLPLTLSNVRHDLYGLFASLHDSGEGNVSTYPNLRHYEAQSNDSATTEAISRWIPLLIIPLSACLNPLLYGLLNCNIQAELRRSLGQFCLRSAPAGCGGCGGDAIAGGRRRHRRQTVVLVPPAAAHETAQNEGNSLVAEVDGSDNNECIICGSTAEDAVTTLGEFGGRTDTGGQWDTLLTDVVELVNNPTVVPRVPDTLAPTPSPTLSSPQQLLPLMPFIDDDIHVEDESLC
uniref:G_PROTEIN_RECEP_F1_2 domain-containing protein n=2 Tax=Macrostomum lignano TaxID=282301 RepID=A0A1I8J2M4_9PLAT